MSQPRFTCLIDTYNLGRFVEEAIESVLAQDFPASQMEILVVDDGSTDDTAARLKKYADASRVRYVYKPNGGQASAFNLGFQEARGEFVALLDADDLWLPNKLTLLADAFDRNPRAGMVYHAMEFLNEATGEVTRSKEFAAVEGNVPDRLQDLLTYADVTTSASAFRRSVVNRILPIPEGMRIYADSYLGYLIIFLAPIVALREPLTRYRIHGANLAINAQSSPGGLENRAHSFRQALRAICEWLKKNGYDLQAPGTAAFLKRHELVAQRLGFASQEPGRRQFLAHLLEARRLYAPLWSPGYRAFRAVMAVVGGVLGFRTYEALQGLYRKAGVLRPARETLLPAYSPPRDSTQRLGAPVP